MTAPDYPDWQQPVSVVDQAVEVSGAPLNLASGVVSASFDCRAANSLVLTLFTPPAEAAGVRHMIQVKWAEGTDTSGEDTVTYHSAASYLSAAASLSWRLPVRGSAFTVQHWSSTGTAQLVTAYLSTRTVAAGRPEIQDDVAGAILLDTSFGSIAAGATSATVYVPPVSTQVLVRLNQKLAAVLTTIRTVALEAGVLVNPVVANVLGTDPTNAGLPIPLPGCGLEITATNNDTVAHTTTLAVLDAS